MKRMLCLTVMLTSFTTLPGQAWAIDIHWDIIETGGGPGTATLSTNWGGTGDSGITISQQNSNEWLIDLDSSHELFGLVGRQISWNDLTPGLFNTLTSLTRTQLRYESDLASSSGIGPFGLGVSFSIGTTSAGDDVFASVHEKAIFSTFNTTAEGWEVVDLDFPNIVGSPPNELLQHTPTHSDVGGGPEGQPGLPGHIWFDDETRDVFYWKAPGTFLGTNFTAASRRGVYITFDLKAEGGINVFNQEDIILVGQVPGFPEVTLVYDCLVVPDGTWKTYTVGMYDAGWRVGNLNGPEATREQIFNAFSFPERLYIRGEFRDTMDDIGRLDNVGIGILEPTFAPDSPEPSTLMLLILAAAGFNTRRVLLAVGRRA